MGRAKEVRSRTIKIFAYNSLNHLSSMKKCQNKVSASFAQLYRHLSVFQLKLSHILSKNFEVNIFHL